MERTKLLPAYFLARWRVLLAFAAFSGIYAAVYLLYHEPLEPVLYAGLLTAALGSRDWCEGFSQIPPAAHGAALPNRGGGGDIGSPA